MPRPRKGGDCRGPKSATRRKAGTIRCRSQAKSSEQPNPLSIDPSALDMRGNLFSPLPNSIRGARDDRCWWEAFQGVGEGVNTVTRASKEGKALINSCVCVLLLLRQLHSTVECERHKGTKRGVKPVRLAFAACLRLLF